MRIDFKRIGTNCDAELVADGNLCKEHNRKRDGAVSTCLVSAAEGQVLAVDCGWTGKINSTICIDLVLDGVLRNTCTVTHKDQDQAEQARHTFRTGIYLAGRRVNEGRLQIIAGTAPDTRPQSRSHKDIGVIEVLFWASTKLHSYVPRYPIGCFETECRYLRKSSNDQSWPAPDLYIRFPDSLSLPDMRKVRDVTNRLSAYRPDAPVATFRFLYRSSRTVNDFLAKQASADKIVKHEQCSSTELHPRSILPVQLQLADIGHQPHSERSDLRQVDPHTPTEAQLFIGTPSRSSQDIIEHPYASGSERKRRFQSPVSFSSPANGSQSDSTDESPAQRPLKRLKQAIKKEKMEISSGEEKIRELRSKLAARKAEKSIAEEKKRIEKGKELNQLQAEKRRVREQQAELQRELEELEVEGKSESSG